jgi:hypothetical protein
VNYFGQNSSVFPYLRRVKPKRQKCNIQPPQPVFLIKAAYNSFDLQPQTLHNQNFQNEMPNAKKLKVVVPALTNRNAAYGNFGKFYFSQRFVSKLSKILQKSLGSENLNGNARNAQISFFSDFAVSAQDGAIFELTQDPLATFFAPLSSYSPTISFTFSNRIDRVIATASRDLTATELEDYTIAVGMFNKFLNITYAGYLFRTGNRIFELETPFNPNNINQQLVYYVWTKGGDFNPRLITKTGSL